MTRNRIEVGILLVATIVLLGAGAGGVLAATDGSIEAAQTGTDDSMNATGTDAGAGMNESTTETGMGDSMTDSGMTDSEMTDSGMTETGMDDGMTDSGMTETGMDDMADGTEETTTSGPGFGALAVLAALIVGAVALASRRSR